jgi:hypothetical protein
MADVSACDLIEKEAVAICEPPEQQAVTIKPFKGPVKSAKPRPKTDEHATNQLLEAYLRLQNQFNTWAASLQQAAEYYDAVLTPSQKEAVRLALVCSKRTSKRLQRIQRGLTK